MVVAPGLARRMKSEQSPLVVTPVGNGMYRVADGDRTRVAYAAGPADNRWVFLDGRVYAVEVQDRSAQAARYSGSAADAHETHPVAQRSSAAKKRRDHGGDLSSPMPA